MALENLYQCSQAEIEFLYRDLTTAFFDDDLYQVAFPDVSTRKACMQHYFKYYLQAIGPDCTFLADSEEKNCIMVVYDSRKCDTKSYIKRMCIMNFHFLKFIFLLGIKQSFALLKEWDMFSSRWTKDFVRSDSFHLDLIFTKQEKQHQGIAERMVRELIDEGDIMDMDVTVETHHRKNALWYEKLGFVLMNTIVDSSNNLHQYCLLVRNTKE